MQQNIANFFGKKELDTLHLSDPRKTYWKSGKSKGDILVKQLTKPILINITYDRNISLIPINKMKYNFSKKIISVIKSNLQKAIRRNEVDVALTSASYMLMSDGGSNELLRRLCIIIVEDKLCGFGDIANHYHTLVWIMITQMAWKGWRSWLLGLIKYMCNKRHYPCILKTDKKNMIKWSDNPYSCSLLLRKSYGGMKGDMKLLDFCSDYVKTIEIKTKYIFPIRTYSKKIEVMPSAIDFHCDRNMLSEIKETTDYGEDIIKKIIWIYSSSIRYLEPIPNKNIIWESIKNKVVEYQRTQIYFIVKEMNGDRR